MKKLIVVSAIILLSGFVRGEVKTEKIELIGGNADSRKAYFAQPIRIWGSNGFMKDPKERYTLISLSNAKISYVFSLHGKVDSDGNLKAELGILRPSSANWFSGGFFSFDVGGSSTKNCNVEVSEIGEGSFTLKYTRNTMTATFKIILPDDDDKLLLEFNPNEKEPVQRCYRVQFLCYPSSLAGGYNAGKNVRKREMLTSARTIAGNSKRTVLGDKEMWILFYDNYFDVKDNRGEGPCALLFNPKKTARKELIPGNYACILQFWYKMNTPSHFILWDFKGWSNDSAKKYMEQLNISL